MLAQQSVTNNNSSICGGSDCNDNDANINPDATKIYNDLDDDCNGQIDEGFYNNKTHHNSTVCFGRSCNLMHYCNSFV